MVIKPRSYKIKLPDGYESPVYSFKTAGNDGVFGFLWVSDVHTHPMYPNRLALAELICGKDEQIKRIAAEESRQRGIIEAMKLMNEITAPADGVVKSILAENGNMVEYGEILMILE